MISPAVIEEIKLRNPIDGVVSSYVRLQRSGQDLKGLCPFHSEKTPSFIVHPSQGFFHCFGCGAGGDVITFVMRAENLSYVEALEFLAQRAGIVLPQDLERRENGLLTRSENTQMNREAAKFFHDRLLDPQTPEALDYLTRERSMTMPLITRFGLGYAPDSFSALRDHLRSKGYTDRQMVEGGLLQESKNKPGSYFDLFRGRMMIPMLDTSGNVVAFSGRRMDGIKMMKYVNTASTPAFVKGKYVFALNFAKDHCKEHLILCEGQMDVIALHGAGFPQAVATMGTALTDEQARIMKRYTDRVIICYDADEAGQKNAEKAFGILAKAGLETRILRVEGAKDPDEYIKKYGKDAFRKLLEGSKTRFEYKFEKIVKEYDLTSTDGRVKAASEAVKLISSYSSAVERELYVGVASGKLGVTAENLKTEVERALRAERKKQEKAQSDELLRRAQGFRDRVNPQTVGNVAAVRTEETILGLMMILPENARRVYETGDVKEEDFITDFDRRVFVGLLSLCAEGIDADPMLLQDRFTPEETAKLLEMRAGRAELKDNGYAILLDCVGKLRLLKKPKDPVSPIDAISEIIKNKKKT
ncbi:MAG: DNA primase [Clostridia bacterium]|nr:DNA primase [Clostridia bacterium]